jgi:hypothetical protein
MKPSVAAQVVGMDLPPDVEFEDLDAMQAEREQREAELDKFQQSGGKDKDEDVRIPEADAEMTKSAEIAPELTLDQMNELNLWRQLAFRKFKRGEGLDFPFVEKALDGATASAIREQLVRARTEDDIKAAFDLRCVDANPADLMALAEAINRAAEVMTQTELVTQGD